MASRIAAVVETAARALVDSPDAVQVSEKQQRGATVVELAVAPSDIGKIIGRQGRTADALRALVAATAHLHGEKATLEIHDPDGRPRRDRLG
jgi:predicted RNA-binding protein YlqC (UPF0109 family)